MGGEGKKNDNTQTNKQTNNNPTTPTTTTGGKAQGDNHKFLRQRHIYIGVWSGYIQT